MIVAPLFQWYQKVADTDGDGKVFPKEAMEMFQERPWVAGFFCIWQIYALFLGGWSIAGSVLVFRNWTSVNLEDPEHDNYCDGPTYMFAFVFLIMNWCLSPFVSIIACYFVQKED